MRIGRVIDGVRIKGILVLLVWGSGVWHAGAAANWSTGARTTIDLSAEGGDIEPVIHLSPGWVVTVTFVDAGGAPWPLSEVFGPQADWLSYRRASGHPHVVILESRKEGESGNLVVLLESVPAPVHLGIVSDASSSATRVDVRLANRRSDALFGEAAAALGRGSLDELIREYLLSHPEVLREALDPARQLVSRVESHRAELLDADGVPALGDPSGAVTVVEFFDYRCGYCKRSLDAVRAALVLAGVRLQMREYPILGEESVQAARAALAAERQGAYGDAHFALMAHEGSFDAASIEAIAAALGLDLERLRADMASAEVDALIEANRELAGRLGVTGTPAFLVLGPAGVQVSPGALDTDRLAGMIDAASGRERG